MSCRHGPAARAHTWCGEHRAHAAADAIQTHGGRVYWAWRNRDVLHCCDSLPLRDSSPSSACITAAQTASCLSLLSAFLSASPLAARRPMAARRPPTLWVPFAPQGAIGSASAMRPEATPCAAAAPSAAQGGAQSHHTPARWPSTDALSSAFSRLVEPAPRPSLPAVSSVRCAPFQIWPRFLMYLPAARPALHGVARSRGPACASPPCHRRSCWTCEVPDCCFLGCCYTLGRWWVIGHPCWLPAPAVMVPRPSHLPLLPIGAGGPLQTQRVIHHS